MNKSDSDLKQPLRRQDSVASTAYQTSGLTWKSRLSYASMQMGITATVFFTSSNVRKYYTDNLGLDFMTVGAIVAVSKCLDLFFDSGIAYVGDNMTTRWGRRKPFIFVSTIILAVAYAMLALPIGQTLDATSWFAIFYFLQHTVGYSTLAISYSALGYELTDDYHERTVLFGTSGAFGSIALLLCAGLNMGLGGMFPDSLGTQNLVSSVVFVALIGVSLPLLMYNTKETRGELVAEDVEVDVDVDAASQDQHNTSDNITAESALIGGKVTMKKPPIIPTIKRMISYSPFRIYLSSFLIGSVGGSTPGILLLYYMQYSTKMTNPTFYSGIIMAVMVCGCMIIIPSLIHASKRYGKVKAICFAYLTSGFVFVILSCMPPSFGGILAMAVSGALVQSASNALPSSMLADIVDYDELHSGERIEAMFAAFHTNISKVIEIPAGVAPMLILGALGYVNNGGCHCGCGVQCDDGVDVNAGCMAPSDYGEANCTWQPAAVEFGLRVLFTGVPGLCLMLAGLVMWRFPITMKVHNKILKGILHHQDSESAIDPLTKEIVLPPSLQRDPADVPMYQQLDHFYAWELRSAVQHQQVERIRMWVITQLSLWTTVLTSLVLTMVITPFFADTTVMSTVLSLASIFASVAAALVAWEVGRLRAFDTLSSSPFEKEFVPAGIERYLEKGTSVI
eukprot:GFYU01011554.1.p1 GENE.GFYU01011554.1~~GFYU01011554.1.p1  ORF type:complete len:679 (-),score=181.11 GFYU01011554.1:659-2695(-)